MPDPNRQTVSASQVPALFGVSPWTTEWMLYHHFLGRDIGKVEDRRMRLGILMQPIILQLVSEEMRLDVNPRNDYVSAPPVGCTLDADVVCPSRGPGIVETKRVDWLRWRQTYGFDETETCVTAPAYYELQVQAQFAAVPEARWGVIATMVGDDIIILERRPDPEAIERIKDRAARFLADVAARREPKPIQDIDYELVEMLMPPVNEDPPLDLRGQDTSSLLELALAYKDTSKERLKLEKEEKGAKAQLLNWVREQSGEEAPGVVLTDDGVLTTKRGGDTLYRMPYEVSMLAQWAQQHDAPEELVRAVLDMEQAVVRKGGLRINWKGEK
jgi:predicted phage-related endonuclease